jgi:hypothetical protein
MALFLVLRFGILRQGLELLPNGESEQGDLEVRQVGQEVLAVGLPGQEDEAVAAQVGFALEACQNVARPIPALLGGQALEGQFVGRDHLVELQQAIFGGEHKDVVRLQAAGVRQVLAEQRAGVQLPSRSGAVKFGFYTGDEDDGFHGGKREESGE